MATAASDDTVDDLRLAHAGAATSVESIVAVGTAKAVGPIAVGCVEDAATIAGTRSSIATGAMAKTLDAEATGALAVAVFAEPARRTGVASLASPVAEHRGLRAVAPDRRRIADTTAVALGSVDFGALLVAQLAVPQWTAQIAGESGPVSPKVVVEAGAGCVSKARATAVAWASDTTGADQAAVITSVAEGALARSGTQGTIVAETMPVAWTAGIRSGARGGAGCCAEIGETRALAIDDVALAMP